MDEQTETRAAAVPSRPGRSPIVVFLVLLALVLAVAVVAAVTRKPPEADATAEPIEHTNFALTDAEAIARFKELYGVALRAGRQRDLSLTGEAFAPASPAMRRAVHSIKNLLSDKVIDLTRTKIISLDLVSNSETRIVVREVGLLFPCYVTESGRVVTTDDALVREITDWSLVPDGSLWRIFDGSFVHARELDRRNRACG